VIGQGVTFTLPGLSMSGHDVRGGLGGGVPFSQPQFQIACGLSMHGRCIYCDHLCVAQLLHPGALIMAALGSGLALAGSAVLQRYAAKSVASVLRSMVAVIRNVAEGHGNLSQKAGQVKCQPRRGGVLAQWINSLIIILDRTVGDVRHGTDELGEQSDS